MERMIQLREYNTINTLTLITEGATRGGRPRLRGVFQRADEANQNNRIYPKNLLERETAKLNKLIEENRLVGELDHPNYETVKLQNASHKITALYMEGSEVIGELEILTTPAGKVVTDLIESGVNLGISSRAMGSLSEASDSGAKTVNDDLDMKTYDIVADPSVKGAFPGITESREACKMLTQTYQKVLGEKIFLTMLTEAVEGLDEARSFHSTGNPETGEGAGKPTSKSRKLGGAFGKFRSKNLKVKAKAKSDASKFRAQSTLNTSKEIVGRFRGLIDENAQQGYGVKDITAKSVAGVTKKKVSRTSPKSKHVTNKKLKGPAKIVYEVVQRFRDLIETSDTKLRARFMKGDKAQFLSKIRSGRARTVAKSKGKAKPSDAPSNDFQDELDADKFARKNN